MRWLKRLRFWTFCGEYLVLLRLWMPPSAFVVLGLALFVRLSLVHTLPHYAAHVYVWLGLMILFVLRFLLCFGKEARRKREHYESPETGFPWLSKYLGVRPRRSVFALLVVEPVLALGVVIVLLMFSNNRIVLPRAYLEMQAAEVSKAFQGSGSTQAEKPLMPYSYQVVPPPAPVPQAVPLSPYAVDIALGQLLLSVLALFISNVTEWRSWSPRAPRVKKIRAARAAKKAELFQRVRLQRHTSPGVPSVATLARRFARS